MGLLIGGSDEDLCNIRSCVKPYKYWLGCLVVVVKSQQIVMSPTLPQVNLAKPIKHTFIEHGTRPTSESKLPNYHDNVRDTRPLCRGGCIAPLAPIWRARLGCSASALREGTSTQQNWAFLPPCMQFWFLVQHCFIMDPLSVAASVAGLVSLAGQLVPALYNLGSAVKEANKDAQAAATEVASMSVVLQGLQTYIMGRTKANPQRLRLITVEHITASLTACVFTYSELDAVLKALHVDSGLKARDRAVWFMKRESVQNLVSRLQNHKMSFTCMLNILQWRVKASHPRALLTFIE